MDLYDVRITGSKVFLRLLDIGDAESFLQYLIRNMEFHTPFVPLRESDFYTLSTAKRYVSQRERLEADQQYVFGVFERSGRLCGKIALNNIVRGAFQNAYIGYDIDHTVINQGYMTQALRMLVPFAFSALGLHRLQAAIMPRNDASRRVVEKAGFIREGYSEKYLKINGVWEDHDIFALTTDRYELLPFELKYSGTVTFGKENP
jgi:ribosomal-protein-alanine N-acetyltransferase